MLWRRSAFLLACLTLLLGILLLAGDHGAQAYTPTTNPYDIAPAAPGNEPPQGATTDPDPAPPPGGPPWYGEVHILILLIQFPDYPASSSHDAEYFEELLFAHEPGSMWDFYNENSYGRFSINGTVVPIWLNATYNMTYYGNHEFSNSEAQGNAQTLVREAVQLADQYVDFGPFDEDGDGYVDHLAMVHSGPVDEANGGGGPDNDPAIWSHRWGITAEQVDGVNVTGYFMQGEGTPMGVFAHEYGHNLGLPDLYDTDYSSSGIGRWGIMSGGSWNNGGHTPAQFCAWSKIAMGWLEPTIPSGTTANLTVPRIEDNTLVYKLPIGGLDSPEYFLFENRQKVLYDTYLPSHGLLIWHIDEEASQPNDSHRLVDLEEFDNNDNPNQGTEPWANSSAGFHDDSTPRAHSYDGEPTGFSIFAISNSSDNMTVRVILPRNVAVVGVGPALAELNQALELSLAVQNRGFINETDITAHLRVLDDGGTEVLNRSATIAILEVGESTTLNWEWTPLTRKPYTLEGWIDWNDSLPGDDSRSGGLNVTTIFLKEDFEADTNDWTTINDGTAPLLWHLTDHQSISGQQSYWVGRESHGSYLDNMDQSLVTPELNLTGLKWVTMTFQHRYHNELNYDGGVVDLSSDNGSTWQRLTPEEGYDATIAALGGQVGYTGGSEGWRLANYNLTDHLDQTVRLRYRFVSDAGVVDEGWFIDDVVLHGTYERDVALVATEEELTPLPGDMEAFEIRITNSGGEVARFDLTAQLPANWSLPDLPASVELQPSETMNLGLNLSLPAEVIAGDYNTTITATHRDDPNVTARASLPVEVQEVTGLQLSPGQEAGTGEPGAVLVFIFKLSNQGNVPETVTISLEGLTGGVENSTVELEPYSSIDNVTVWVRVPTYANASQQFQGYVEGAGNQTTTQTNLTLTADQVHGITVSAFTEALNVLPDENLTLDLTLTNTGNGPAWTNASLTLPEGWVSSQLNFSAWLTRDDNLTWQVNLTPGWELVNTTVELSLEATSGSADDEWQVNLTYHQIFDLEVGYLASRIVLLPDEIRDFTVNLTNHGNGDELLELQAWFTNGEDWALGVNSLQFTLASEESAQLEGQYRPPADALGGHVATLWLVVDSGDNITQGRNGQLEVEKVQGFTLAGDLSSIGTGEGDNETWTLTVSNVGNVPLEVNLTLEDGESWHHGSNDDPHLALEVDEYEEVRVWITGDRSVLKDTLGELKAIATSGELEDSTTLELVMGAYPGARLTYEQGIPDTAVPDAGSTVALVLNNDANFQQSFNVTFQPRDNWTIEVVTNEKISLEAWTAASMEVLFIPHGDAYLRPGSNTSQTVMVDIVDNSTVLMAVFPVEVGTYHGLELQGPNGTLTIEPKQENTFDLSITNLGNEPALLNHTLSELPVGWQAHLTIPSSEEALGPGANRTLSLALTPEAGTLAGTLADLEVVLFDNWTTHNLTFGVEVAAIYGLAMEETYPTVEVANGENRTLELIIYNQGNLEQSVDLSLIPLEGFDWSWGLITAETTVPALGQTTVTAWVKVPDEVRGREWFRGRLQVTSQDDSPTIELKVHRDFMLQVAELPRLEGQLRFDTFRAGKLSEAYLELTNDGNIPLWLNISVTKASWGENLTNVYVHYLDPGEQKNITLRLEPPESYAGNASILVTLDSSAFDKPQTVSGLVEVQAAPEEDDPFPWVRLLMAILLIVVIVALALPLVPWRRRETEAGTDDELVSPQAPGMSPGPGRDGEGAREGNQSRERAGPKIVEHETFARPGKEAISAETEPEAPGVTGSSESPEVPEVPKAMTGPPVAAELLEEPKPVQRLERTKCPNCDKTLLITDEVTELGKVSCFWCNTKVTVKPKV